MSDGSDPGSIAIGAGVAGGMGLAIAFVRSLFTRNVAAAERAQEKMQQGIENILLELRSMHDEQNRLRNDLSNLTEKYATLKDAVAAEHARIDALVSVPPRVKQR